MKRTSIIIAALCAMLAMVGAANADSADFQLVIFGQIQQVDGRKVTFSRTDGQTGSIEFSPAAEVHDASSPPPARITLADIRAGDIFVLGTDRQQKTHIIVYHQNQRIDRTWDALFVQVVPGYRTVYPTGGQSAAAPPRTTSPSAGQATTGEGRLKVVMMGKVTSISGAQVVILGDNGKRSTITVPDGASWHDLALPYASSGASGRMQVGDMAVMTADSADRPHVLYLHAGANLHPSWNGRVAPPQQQ